MKQIIFIHGGIPSENYKDFITYVESIEYNPYKERQIRWKNTLGEELGANYEVFLPGMPRKDFANYDEWKIMFEKTFQYLDEDVILIGHSLGGTFLVKYLQENHFPKKIKALFLVAAAYSDSELEKLGSFKLKQDMTDISSQVDKIILIHSVDDFVVDFSDFETFRELLDIHKDMIFKDKGHFLQENFPEIIDEIKNLD